MNELKSFFVYLKAKSPTKLIDSGIHRAMNFDRNALRFVSEQTYEPIITYVFTDDTYVSTHNDQNPEVFNVIKSYLTVLQKD